MAVGTDKEIFNEWASEKTAPSVGRPKANRDLARRLFQNGFTPDQVARRLKCSIRTAQNIRKELVKAGLLEGKKGPPPLTEADFNEETKTAVGIYFSDWIKGKRPKSWKPVYSFCEKTWEHIWNRPSLRLIRDTDPSNKLPDQLAQAFVNEFGEDRERLRTRKKLIRPLFTFLGRGDINDRFLTMTVSRDPRRIKRIPELTLTIFPIQLDAAIEEYEEKFGASEGTRIRFKLVSQARTGEKGEYRGVAGISINTRRPSYCVFADADNWRMQVFEKMGETWQIRWMPKRVREGVHTLYLEAKNEEREYLFASDGKGRLLKEWRAISKKHTGIELTYHDLRKVSLTWFYAMDIRLMDATRINAGWKDLNTAFDHYLHYSDIMKRSERAAYRANIPEWFKDGLGEYVEERDTSRRNGGYRR